MREPLRFTSRPPEEGENIPIELTAFRYREETVPDHDGGDGIRTRRVREDITERFEALPDVSGGVLLQIDMMGVGSRRGVNARGGDVMYDFFDAALVPDDRARFRKFIEDPDVFIESAVLTQLLVALYEAYTDRPTKAPGS